jgi:hypothetical protein
VRGFEVEQKEDKCFQFSRLEKNNKTMKKEWKSAVTESYQDLLLKEEIRNRRLKIGDGILIRPVPLLKESDQYTWIMPVHAISNRHGRIPHPRSLRTNRSSLVDSAYTFIRSRYPERLFSRTNLRGLRLLTDLLAVAWVIVDKGNGPVLKLIVENGYDGSRGGKAGLGYQIYQAARAGFGGAEFGAEDPHKGCLIKIDKVTDGGTSTYRIERKD